MVSDWIGEARAPSAGDGGIEPEALARAHARFEQIHPFLDGNGGAGRLVLNLILVRLGYPPAIIFKGDRRRYLAALQSADRGDYGPLGELLSRAILDNRHRFVVPAVAGPSRLVPLPAFGWNQWAIPFSMTAARTPALVYGDLRRRSIVVVSCADGVLVGRMNADGLTPRCLPGRECPPDLDLLHANDLTSPHDSVVGAIGSIPATNRDRRRGKPRRRRPSVSFPPPSGSCPRQACVCCVQRRDGRRHGGEADVPCDEVRDAGDDKR